MRGPEPSADKLSDLLVCALSWEPRACLLGNVTAAEIVQICRTAQLNEMLARRWNEASDDAEERIDRLGERLDAAEAQLAAVREAWAAQVRDLAPRVGLRALAGVPPEVLALLSPPGPDATETP